MQQKPAGTESVNPIFAEASEQPNGPDVSGTSFPLLTTVLAGFAITIAVQLILRPAADGGPLRVFIALISFLLSTLLFLSAIGYGLIARASNYLPFLDRSETGGRLLHVDDRCRWIRRMVQLLGGLLCGGTRGCIRPAGAIRTDG